LGARSNDTYEEHRLDTMPLPLPPHEPRGGRRQPRDETRGGADHEPQQRKAAMFES